MTVYEFKPDEYSSHVKIITYLKSHASSIKGKLKLLDVGCSKGYIGQHLDHDKFELFGVESAPEDAAAAKKFYKEVRVLDADKMQFGYGKKQFDVIIVASVIEHLKNPWAMMEYINSLLKDDGLLVLSTSNVGNIYSRLKLLFGNFDYEDKGIFDKTHLRFFTLKTFRKLAKEANFMIVHEEFTPVPLPTVHQVFSKGKPLNIMHKTSNQAMKLWKRMLCFEFILYCKKANLYTPKTRFK
jgi:O-antigen biosynthesis protein